MPSCTQYDNDGCSKFDIDDEFETLPYHLAARMRMAAEHTAVTPPATFVPPVKVEIPPAEWEVVAAQYPEAPEPVAEGSGTYVMVVSVEELADALREAKDAHTAFEQAFGEPDNDWPTWYAQYLLGEIQVQS